jgi:pyridoxine 5-phosphate synthase
MAPTDEMVNIAVNAGPNACCIVPEKREEITTEGGIDVRSNHNILVPKIEKIKKNNIRVSLFIDASMDQIKIAKEIGADIVELHTGEFCRKINYNEDASSELERIREAADFSNSIGLELHFGHGITFDSVGELSKIKEVKEFNIGHFIISESVFLGLEKSISKFRELIKKGREIQ